MPDSPSLYSVLFKHSRLRLVAFSRLRIPPQQISQQLEIWAEALAFEGISPDLASASLDRLAKERPAFWPDIAEVISTAKAILEATTAPLGDTPALPAPPDGLWSRMGQLGFKPDVLYGTAPDSWKPLIDLHANMDDTELVECLRVVSGGGAVVHYCGGYAVRHFGQTIKREISL